MDPTSSEQLTNTQPENQETLEKSNTQKRIDELTAEKRASEQRAAEAATQVSQLTATVAEMLRNQNANVRTEPAPTQLPEDVPGLAKYFDERMQRMQKEAEARTQQMYWQMQNQMDQSNVAQRYAHLPKEVVAEASNRLTGLKQRFGEANVTMDEAVALAHWAWVQKQGNRSAAQQFNAMGQPMQTQSAGPTGAAPSTNLVPPSSLPGWDELPLNVQIKLIDKYEKEGGKLMGS